MRNTRSNDLFFDVAVRRYFLFLHFVRISEVAYNAKNAHGFRNYHGSSPSARQLRSMRVLQRDCNLGNAKMSACATLTKRTGH